MNTVETTGDGKKSSAMDKCPDYLLDAPIEEQQHRPTAK